ncbi:MAG: hypothetical protein P4M11_11220 [Candidatus Pacebacteria bacterium]|nr:hypothetical protein [Candidatus Paceibacterota bacterium]
MSSIVLTPYIYRAQRNVTLIIALFLNIDREEIKKKIAHYETMREKIDSYFSRIRKFFWNTNFTPETVESRRLREGGNPSLQRVLPLALVPQTPIISGLPANDDSDNPDQGVPQQKPSEEQELESNKLLERNSKIEEIKATRYCAG